MTAPHTAADTAAASAEQVQLDEATRLSTQPAAPQLRAGLLGPLRFAWRRLTSMRTALLLLFLLALASVPGGFLPQRRLNPLRVQTYLDDHPTLGPLLDRLQLFDVFTSAWFSAVYLLLFISLCGCLLPRTRLHLRALRAQPPAVPRTLARLPASDSWETEDDVLARAEQALRRWRVVRRGSELSAERGYLRETGNLVFHLSLVLLLVGIAIGAFRGFTGTVLVVEGTGFSNTIASFDDIKPGRRFHPSSLVPFNVQLQDFRATYAPDGKALTFDAMVRWGRGQAVTTPYDLRVNHPLAVGGAKTYLIGHGYAPVVRVKDRTGAVVLEQPMPCLPQTPQFLSTCVIKAPDAAPHQLGFRGAFTPTTVTEAGRVGSSYPGLVRPVLTLVGYSGDLGLDGGAPQSVYALDTTSLKAFDNGQAHALRPGQTWQLPGGGSLTYVDTKEWATFQVTQDPGKVLALIAAVGIVAGLMLSLFVRRRRVWVRVVPGTPSTVEVGGLARTDPERFQAEFAGIVARLRERDE
ncbi:MAG TPA: cytochrome c biogenesis protein ResB [Mycobacteriales bacterium]|nr:cytochrome c biogenesis protein ResB [Mycobacteriales bacterium]